MAQRGRGPGSRPAQVIYSAAVLALVVAAASLLFGDRLGHVAGSFAERAAATAATSPAATTLPPPSGAAASAGSTAGTDDCTQLSVVTATSFAPVLDALADDLATPAGPDKACVRLSVTRADGRAAADRLAPARAQVWLPDDTAWAAAADPALLAPGTQDPVVLATSPIYLVTAAGDTGPAQGVTSWSALATALQGPNPPRVVSAEPVGSGDGLVAVAAVGETVWQAAGMDAASGTLAAERPASRSVADPAAEELAADEIALVSERQLLAAPESTGSGAATARSVVAPGDMTAMLRYTWLPTSLDDGAPAVEAARERLLSLLTGPASARALATAGLRGPGMAPLAAGRALPPVQAPPMPSLAPHHVEHVLAAWYPAERKADLLIAVDVSGSMFARPPDSDRTLIAEVKAGVQTVADQLPDDAQLGVWEFGASLDPPRDYSVVAPPTELTPQHRTQLQAAVSAVTARQTGTGLHDTILAAYLQAQSVYRPGVRSEVLVFTDGVNEADPGSLTMEELGDALRDHEDPTRPVSLAVVVFGPDELATALGEEIGYVDGYVTSVHTAADVGNAFAHLAAGGLHG